MSSFSALAKNRVISWQDGVTKMTGELELASARSS